MAVEFSKNRNVLSEAYSACRLCKRECGIDRTSGESGFCACSDKMHISRAALHPWEEPIISGTRGSGTIFFSGCSLGCIFCQNRAISHSEVGKALEPSELAREMIRLEGEGAHNINLVTTTHYAPSVREAILIAREMGLKVPTVYNTGSYDTKETVRALSDVIDVYLPDLKYYLSKTAERYSAAPDYPKTAREAIAEMVRQRPVPVIEDGIMKSGVVVRILLLPGHVAEAKLSLKYLFSEYGDSIYVSLMNQYTPMPGVEKPLNRTVSRAEYSQLVEYAESLGVKNAFIQEHGTASESFIPPFNK